MASLPLVAHHGPLALPLVENRFDPAAKLASLPGDDHNGLAGITFRARGLDWVELELARALAGADGDWIAFPLLTLMDVATGLAVWTRLGGFRPHATLDLRVDHLRLPRPGRIIVGRGQCDHLDDALSFVSGLAHDGDPERPFARVTGTFAFTGPRP